MQLRVIYLLYMICYTKSFLFYKPKLFKPYIFLFENTNESENISENETKKINIKSKSKNKNSKKSSGCDERYEFQNQNITEIIEFKREYLKTMEFFYLLNLLYDDSLPIFNKIYFIEENIFLNKMFEKKNVINEYNVTSGGLFKDWDFKF